MNDTQRQLNASSLSPFGCAIIAGAVAGTTVDVSLYPLDTIKTRLQSSQGFIRAGGFRGVYAGIGSAVVGSAPGAAFFFLSYEAVKEFGRNIRHGRSHTSSGLPTYDNAKENNSYEWMEPLEHMTAASIGEVVACGVRVPTEVIKQRAQALQGRGSWAVLKAVLEQRHQIGVQGVWHELYRGWSITVLREVPFTVIQFPVWEALKTKRRQKTGKDAISAMESALFGSIAGAIAAGVTTPLDVLKTRMMLAKKKERAWPMASRILNESGPTAFVSGMGPRIVWISAGGAIFLGSYQFAHNELSK